MTFAPDLERQRERVGERRERLVVPSLRVPKASDLERESGIELVAKASVGQPCRSQIRQSLAFVVARSRLHDHGDQVDQRLSGRVHQPDALRREPRGLQRTLGRLCITGVGVKPPEDAMGPRIGGRVGPTLRHLHGALRCNYALPKPPRIAECLGPGDRIVELCRTRSLADGRRSQGTDRDRRK